MLYNDMGSITEIDPSFARGKIRGVVELFGRQKLGFSKEDADLCSIRSGGQWLCFNQEYQQSPSKEYEDGKVIQQHAHA